jgi:hypothetical protein
MHYIAHRINTVEELRDLPREHGAEVDLRDRGERLILQHDPFKDGQDFEPWLASYRHGTLILNIKSERIEPKVQGLLRQAGITDYFFLDSSFPMIHLLSGAGERKIALRYSEYEGLDTILAMKGRVEWVWVDCFTRLPITRESYRLLKDAGFRLCLVSPELQGRDADIEAYRSALAAEQIVFDAICTKRYNIERWRG